jgi:hypothetical protein
MGIIGTLIIGLIVGLVARAVMPGKQALGIVLTADSGAAQPRYRLAAVLRSLLSVASRLPSSEMPEPGRTASIGSRTSSM